MAEQERKQPTEILELTTVRQRRQIKIDGAAYDVCAFDEFELPEFLELLPAFEKFRLIDRRKLSKKEGSEIAAVVNQLSKLMLPSVPEATFKKLTPLQKMAIVNSIDEGSATDFFDEMTARIKPQKRSSSRGSNGSTGARRRTGKK